MNIGAQIVLLVNMNPIFVIPKAELKGKHSLMNRLILLSEHVEEIDNQCFYHVAEGRNLDMISLLMEYWVVYEVQFKSHGGEKVFPNWSIIK